MILPIVTYRLGASDNPKVLLEETRPVTDFTAKEVRDCVRDLCDTLDDFIAKNGNHRGISGLSAPQIGVDLAISAVRTAEKQFIMINPVVLEERGSYRLFRIGCFSLFDYRAMVRYNDDILVEYQDDGGNVIQESFSGDRACVIQHEIDHLHGLLLFARLPHGEKDLFVPGHPADPSRRITAPEQFSFLFNDYTDLATFTDQQAERFRLLLDTVRDVTPAGGSVLELGDGTSAAAVILGREGYKAEAQQKDRDMAALGRRISEANGASASVTFSNSPYLSGKWNTIFSSERFQFMEESALQNELAEILSCADHAVLLVPTPLADASVLRGGEHLRTTEEWVALLGRFGLSVSAPVIPYAEETVLVISSR